MANSPAEVRIEQLEKIEEDIINILKTSGNCLLEVAKDRPSQKAVDNQVQQVGFFATLFKQNDIYNSIFFRSWLISKVLIPSCQIKSST